MKHTIARRSRVLVAAAVLASAGPAAALVPHDVCLNQATGVPTRGGPPIWAAWPGAGTVDATLDDPRWNRANLQSFATGTAKPPVHVRQLWGEEGGQKYLYLSLISDLSPNTSTSRDVFVGFRRALPGVAGDDAGVYGYVFQFHLKPGGDQTAAPMAYCGNFGKPECTDDNAASVGNWWRVFRDFNATKTVTCRGMSQTGEEFKQWNGDDTSPADKDWLVAPVDLVTAHAWKLGGPAGTRWAIQLRVKIAPATPGTPTAISAGIEPGSTLWYEATETSSSPYVGIAKFPPPNTRQTGVTRSVCVSPAGPVFDFLVHPDLAGATNWAKLTPLGTPPSDCDTGLTLVNIGARFNQGPPYDAIGTLNAIKATDSAGVTHANTIIAQIKNTNPVGDPAISATVRARFRLANWGSGPFGGDPGEFTDIRGGSAVCLPTGGPTCAAQTLASTDQRAIHFDWTLGSDTSTGGLGGSELCAYGLNPPSGTCDVCTCDGSQPGCPAGTPGKGVAGRPCVLVHAAHQCMYVELSSPSSDVNFVQASMFNNMIFGQMSTVAREALIDARKLPRAPNQTVHDIYFFVMPRNMPASVAAGTTVTELIQEAALDRALQVSAPYLADVQRLQREDPERLKRIIDELARQRPNGPGLAAIPNIRAAAVSREDKRLPMIRVAAQVMPNDDFARVGTLTSLALDRNQSDHANQALVEGAVTALGPSDAAELVPTLEIYPFYKVEGDAAYEPMTSFTLFLSHEAALDGMRYELDGATKVAENVYHLEIPVGFARKIQVRAQALVASEAALPSGNPSWPCAGGCACGGGAQRRCGLLAMVGNTTPGLIAGVLVIRRRKKKPAS